MDASLPHLLAKSASTRQPDGESLTHHSLATLIACHAIASRIGALPCITGPDGSRFWDRAAWGALAHDAGKCAHGFQSMITDRTSVWGQRHEVVSLGFLPRLLPAEDLTWVALAVACHHRALTGDSGKPSLATLYRDEDLDVDAFCRLIGPVPDADVDALTQWLADTAAAHDLPPGLPSAGAVSSAEVLNRAYDLLHRLLDGWEITTASAGLTAVLLQGAVTYADHLSSSGGHLHARQPFDHRYRRAFHDRLEAAGATPYPHQTAAANHSGHLLLRAPTGAGKTEAALLWALRQIDDIATATGGVPRLYYTLPYLASINAMIDRLQRTLGEMGDRSGELIGVTHSRAASYYLAASIGTGDPADTRRAARKALARAHATRLFRETVRIGTPYQLMRAALAGPAHSSTLLDTVNSVFILDELHAYDPKRLGFLLACTRFWAQLGGRVGVLSATIPDRLVDLLQATLGELHQVTPAHQSPARHRIHTSRERLTDPHSIAAIAQQLHTGRRVLVVANNVAQAQTIYTELGPLARELHGPDAAWLLHSRYRRCDRRTIETAIHARWSTGSPARPGLLVGTQAIEVSLDIDMDTAHVSAATLDALIQRFGRVNRVGARPPADIIVHAPTYGTRRGDQSGQLFADGVYPQPPVAAAWQYLTGHDGCLLDDHTAASWLNEIYAGDWGDAWAERVADEQRKFTESFLTFTSPMRDRADLDELFSQLFDGAEAILDTDRDEYAASLSRDPGSPAAGRLPADELLIPLPWYAHARYDKKLRVRLINGDYTAEHGLIALRRTSNNGYRPGEIL